MRSVDWVVLLGSAGFLLAFYWWFFWSKREHRVSARATAGIQEVEVTVKGGYDPDVVTVRQGLPVRLNFRREESGECTERVVIPDFHINKPLSAFATTAVEFNPEQEGTYDFACGMGMIHGKIVVVPRGRADS